MKTAQQAFKTLSDETRLRILNLILERECCVCEVMQALEISQSKASRGLSLLTQAVKEFMKDNKMAVLDKERLAKAERIGTGCARRLKQSMSCRKA
jgi:DNA-binding transcriptional ArsR family regulator